MDAFPTIPYKIPDILVACAIWVLQNILAVIIPKQAQGLLFIKLMKFGESENFARAFVNASRIDQDVFPQPITEFSGLVVVIFGDDNDGFIKADGYTLGNFFDKFI